MARGTGQRLLYITKALGIDRVAGMCSAPGGDRTLSRRLLTIRSILHTVFFFRGGAFGVQRAWVQEEGEGKRKHTALGAKREPIHFLRIGIRSYAPRGDGWLAGQDDWREG